MINVYTREYRRIGPPPPVKQLLRVQMWKSGWRFFDTQHSRRSMLRSGWKR